MVIVLTTKGFRAINPAHIGMLDPRRVAPSYVRGRLDDAGLDHIKLPDSESAGDLMTLSITDEWIEMIPWYTPTREDMQRREVLAQKAALKTILHQMQAQAQLEQEEAQAAMREKELDRIAPRIIVPGQ
jgi:hypothetical protein